MLDMPQVIRCQAMECSYNKEGKCHALAITVGDPEAARCDTFFPSSQKGGDPDAIGRVGACKMTSCVYNEMLECQASGITVDVKGDEADCVTYREE